MEIYYIAYAVVGLITGVAAFHAYSNKTEIVPGEILGAAIIGAFWPVVILYRAIGKLLV